jgi:hypothetical protein
LKIITVSICAILFIVSAASFASDVDTTYAWKKKLDLSLNVTQSSYSDNWTGGEASNVTWVANANGVFEKQTSPKFNTRTTVKLAFGQTLNQDPETNDWEEPVKSTDKIDIESVARFTLGYFVDPYGALRVETQFVDKSVDSIARYFNPAIVTASAGAAKELWTRPEKDQLISRLGIAVKNTFDQEIINYATEETEIYRTTEGGLESVTDLSITFDENVSLISKLTLFKAFLNSEEDELEGTEEEDYWKAVDVNLENTLTVQVKSYIQVSLYTQLLYDKEVDLGGRFKETLALGITYKLL